MLSVLNRVKLALLPKSDGVCRWCRQLRVCDAREVVPVPLCSPCWHALWSGSKNLERFWADFPVESAIWLDGVKARAAQRVAQRERDMVARQLSIVHAFHADVTAAYLKGDVKRAEALKREATALHASATSLERDTRDPVWTQADTALRSRGGA